MEYTYKFLNREKELYELEASLKKLINTNRSKAGFIIQGREGIGKTRLIDEFINNIANEVDIYSEIPKFNKSSHVLDCACKEGGKPYEPFLELKELIDKRNKFLKIIVKFFQAIMAVFGINDLYNALADLRQSIIDEKDSAVIRKKEGKIFKSYVKYIERKSRKVPLVVFIKRSQWIDEYSIKLVGKLLTSEKSLWGIIILEIDDLEQDYRTANIHILINELVAEKALKRIVLSPLDNNFPARLMEDRFGEGFLTWEENDILFTVSQGTPGLLISLLEKSIDEKWIYKEGNKWRKKDNFKELIKPKFQHLIELICTTYHDHFFDEGELQLIRNMAAGWDISKKLLEETISMVKCIMDQDFTIIRNLGPGILSNNSFIISDIESERYIVEYLPSTINPQDSLIKQRNFKQGNLLEAKEIRITENGVLIIWKYIDAIRTRSLLIMSNEVHVKNVVEKIKQITKALVELHKQGAVHGFIKPESIFKAKNDQYYLATFDISLINILPKNTINENRYYLSPEQLEGKAPDLRSDIFSLGVLFYESLTEHLPFNGNTNENLLENIKQNAVQFDGTLVSLVPPEIQDIIRNCLQVNPDERYKNAEEFYVDLKKVKNNDNYSEVISAIHSFNDEGKFEEAKKLLAKIHNLSVKRRIEDEITAAQIVQKKKSKFSYSYVLLGIVACLIIAFIFFWDGERDYKSYIAVEVKQVDSVLSNRPIRSAMLEYLLLDDISQNSNEKVLALNDFDKLFPETDPRILLTGEIKNGASEYEFRIQITDSSKTIISSVFSANDPFKFLSEIVPEVSSSLFGYLKIKKVRKSTFTDDWDAFVNFFEGEEYSSILERDLAVEHFERAAILDKNFILAKLRLASILRGNNNIKSNSLLQQIWQRTGELSKADSLKAVALKHRLEGNLREAIKAYRQIIEFKPANKESYFDVAEVYFDLREIENAKKYYQEALKIDNDFSLAINHLAYCYSTLGDHSEAIKLFRRYVELDSTANSFDSMGDGYAAAGLIDSAVWAKREGISLDRNLEYLYSSLAGINFIGGRINEANKCLKDYFEIINSRPDTNYQQLSTGYFLSALTNYIKDSNQAALQNCKAALTLFDSDNLVIRNNELHWLLAILNFKRGDNDGFLNEVSKMDSLITRYDINNTNYNEILKFRKHLEAIQAAKNGDIQKLDEIIKIFDGPIKWKIKDHTSIFDLAFFNNSFGELYLQLNQLELAEERFKKATEYNNNYAMAHHNLAKLYVMNSENIKAENERKKYDVLWQKADIKPSHFVKLYNNIIGMSTINN